MATEEQGVTGGLGSSGVQVRKFTKGATNRSRSIFPIVRFTWATAMNKSSCLRFENMYTAPAHIPRTTKVYCESLPVSTGESQVSNSSTTGQVIHTSTTRHRASFRILLATALGKITLAASQRQFCRFKVRANNRIKMTTTNTNSYDSAGGKEATNRRPVSASIQVDPAAHASDFVRIPRHGEA